MNWLFLSLLLCHAASAVKHSLKAFYTGSSGVLHLPEVVAVMLINDIQVGYCDSKIKTAIPKQDWMEELRDSDPNHWKVYTGECTVYQQVFKEEFHNLKQRLNQTGSVQILQKMHGCEWDDETGDVHGYQQYGYNAEDFLAFDLKTETWVAVKPQAVITRHFWDRQRTRNLLWKDYLTHTCIDFLKKYVHFGRRALLRTDLPSVSLLQKTPSSPVSCHATGFYPDRAVMFWRKDGEELYEDVEHGEILPNHDGSFQMSIDLDVSSVAPEDWMKYDCVFHFSGRKDLIVTKLDRAAIRTNWKTPVAVTVSIVVAVIALGLILAAVGFIVYKKRKAQCPASSADDGSELSDKLSPET